MSASSPSEELRRTRKVNEALVQLQSGSKPGGRQGARAVTHRCRIYRLISKAIPEDRSVYTVVWDTLERPLKNRSLPQGELYFASSGSSHDTLGKELEFFCQRLGRVVISDWNAAGSI